MFKQIGHFEEDNTRNSCLQGGGKENAQVWITSYLLLFFLIYVHVALPFSLNVIMLNGLWITKRECGNLNKASVHHSLTLGWTTWPEVELTK